MPRWRQLGTATAISAASVVFFAAVLPFLAPNLSYEIKDRVTESLSGNSGRTYRIALGVATGSHYRLGTVLNRYLKAKSGYELELVATGGVPENVDALLDRSRQIDLAMIESSSDEGAAAADLSGLAAVGRQYFFVIVPNDSAVRDVRDLAGPINPGVRAPAQPPTLGERVLDYYGLLGSPSTSAGKGAAVTIVRPSNRGNLGDFEAGHMTAATRTQFLQSDLIDGMLKGGNYRLVPIRDHEALARALPGTEPGFIPAGGYGPERRIPPEPVPTIAVTSLLVARRDVPGRVARDILDAVYDPRFGREIQHELTEESGRKVGDLPLHPAADVFYHRNDVVTSDRIGRLTFVAWMIGAVFTTTQFASRFRRNERMKARRVLLVSEVDRLTTIRDRMADCLDEKEAGGLIAEADDVLCRAERDAASELLDAEGIQSLRSLHRICSRALRHRLQEIQTNERTTVDSQLMTDD